MGDEGGMLTSRGRPLLIAEVESDLEMLDTALGARRKPRDTDVLMLTLGREPLQVRVLEGIVDLAVLSAGPDGEQRCQDGFLVRSEVGAIVAVVIGRIASII